MFSVLPDTGCCTGRAIGAAGIGFAIIPAGLNVLPPCSGIVVGIMLGENIRPSF